MTVWQVWDGDYEGNWVEASYASKALADAHCEAYPRRRLTVSAVEVLDALDEHAAARTTKRARRVAK